MKRLGVRYLIFKCMQWNEKRCNYVGPLADMMTGYEYKMAAHDMPEILSLFTHCYRECPAKFKVYLTIICLSKALFKNYISSPGITFRFGWKLPLKRLSHEN